MVRIKDRRTLHMQAAPILPRLAQALRSQRTPATVAGCSPVHIEAMHNPRHPQYADYLRWWGGPFDPKGFSINAANMAIRKLR